MKKIVLLLFLAFVSVMAFAQYGINEDSVVKKYRTKVVVFAPVFLDTVFTGNKFNVTDNSLPKFMLSGLDFYNGAMMAVDSLRSEKRDVEIIFYDSKSKTEPLTKILNYKVWDSVSLIIASFKDRNEIKPMADFALKRKIPLVSATYPNDGGVTKNPYFIVLNSTLRTHIEGLYKYTQNNYAISNIVYVKTKGKLEDDMLNIFKEAGKETVLTPLKYKVAELTDSFTTKQLLAVLDSTKQNTIICGTVNENFGGKLIRSLNNLKAYKTIAIGMPTWDGIKEVNKAINVSDDEKEKVVKAIEVIYSTPFYFSKPENVAKSLASRYKNKFAARGSDWFYKGFESVYYFTNILLKNKDDFFANLNSNEFVLFNNFKIETTQLKNSTTPDYLENKKLHFIKKQNGVVKSVN